MYAACPSITDNTICSPMPSKMLLYKVALCFVPWPWHTCMWWQTLVNFLCEFVVIRKINLFFFLLELRQIFYHRFQYAFNGMAYHIWMCQISCQTKTKGVSLIMWRKFKTFCHFVQNEIEKSLIEQTEKLWIWRWRYWIQWHKYGKKAYEKSIQRESLKK